MTGFLLTGSIEQRGRRFGSLHLGVLGNELPESGLGLRLQTRGNIVHRQGQLRPGSVFVGSFRAGCRLGVSGPRGHVVRTGLRAFDRDSEIFSIQIVKRPLPITPGEEANGPSL